MQAFLSHAAALAWGPLTTGLLMVVGGYLTIQTRIFPLRRAGAVVKTTFKSLRAPCGANGVTPFMAMSAALGATMGTGNIVGVATALTAGGPGAVVWMCAAALVGMMIKLAEIALAVRYRRQGAGPMGYLRLVSPAGGALAAVFAVCCVAAALGTGNMTQSNSIAQALGHFSVKPVFCAVAVGIFTLFATGKGVRGVMVLSSWLVPAITVGYIAAAAAAVWQERSLLFGAAQAMFAQALGIRAAAGGAAGYTVGAAVRFGVARGVFSNEAGMGTAPIAHAEANVSDGVTQGMWGIVEVFLDTIVSCTLTALVLLTAGGGRLWRCGLTGAPLVSACFDAALGFGWGAAVAVFIALFGITSICGWFAYGLRALQSLCPHCNSTRRAYWLLYAAGASIGSVWSAQTVWLLSDLLTGLMTMVNMTGLLYFAPEVCEMVKCWEREQRAAGARRRGE